MMVDAFVIAVQVALMYVPLIFGIYISMGVLSLPDFTMQGSFGIGGAVCAILLVGGANPIVALAAAMVAGALTGLITAALHLWLQLNVLLASILVAAASYSMALVIMGRGNMALSGASTVFHWFAGLGLTKQQSTICAGAVIAVVLGAALTLFMRTRYGVSLVASGQNIQTARGLGIRTEGRQAVGLGIGNGLAAVSGALIVQNQGFMDVTIQNGIIVIGLAGMMVGLSVIRSHRVGLIVCGLVFGVIIYRFVVAMALQVGIDPNMVQLITAVLVVAVVWSRHSGATFYRAFTAQGRKALRINQSRFYEEDRVASFF
jgi:putative tryptophan/tyrosine transport system permease protein